MRAKKLPSGSYRCRVFAGYQFVNGEKKAVYESFTAPTKEESEMMAANWKYKKNNRASADMTVMEAVKIYVQSKENVLSPSTIRGYNACLPRFENIGDLRLRNLKSSDVQLWISKLSADLSPKSVANTYGLLTATLQQSAPDVRLSCKLPSKQRPDYYLPPDEDLQAVLAHVEGTRLWIAMMLARYYSLRRSEICGLRSDDLKGSTLTIRRAMVRDVDGTWVIKDRPKTYTSYRSVTIAEPLLTPLKEIDGQIIDCNPDALVDRFKRALKATKVKPFTFHSLRHMFATSAALNGIPDIYTAQIGGWRQGSGVLKQIYQNVRDEDLQAQMAKLNALMSHEMKSI